VLTGVISHAFGMWDKRRLEAREELENPAWVAAFYWLCWLLLSLVVAMLFL
jgi:hypothetical protein